MLERVREMCLKQHSLFSPVDVDFDVIEHCRDDTYSRILVEIAMKNIEGLRISLNADNSFCPMLQVELCCFATAGANVKNYLAAWQVLPVPHL
jgi:hypothetical protein